MTQQGTDLITQLAQIRERQGKDPLPNPGFIQGFGENDPPSPPPPIVVPGPVGGEGWAEDDEEAPAPTGATHYVAKDFKHQTASQARAEMGLSEEMVVPQFKLIVMDLAASYAGHPTILTQGDADRIAEIVVKSVKRELDAQLATIQPESPGTGLGAPPSPKRGRGRPRKHPVAE